MRRNVLDYEPHTALFVPDEDPLLFYRRIAELCAGQQKEVQVFFEINENLSDEIEDLLHSFGFSDVRITRDMYGKPRVAEGCLIAEKKA
jgi:release factor glutamine methyltransferase